MVVYFSGTGNSQYAAEAIADRLKDEIVCSNRYIKEQTKGSFQSDRPWIFVFPIYIDTMAAIFSQFLRSSDFTGNRKAYFIATCASKMGITPDDGAAICKEKGLEFMGAEQIIMPQNYIALFQMTPPDEIAKRQKNALTSVDRICRAVTAGELLNTSLEPSAEVALFHWIVRSYNKYFTRTGKFTATDHCVSCGMCAKVCPLNNISLVKGKPQWGSSCTHCMACINRCPKSAIEYGKGTIGKQRYVCAKYTPCESGRID